MKTIWKNESDEIYIFYSVTDEYFYSDGDELLKLFNHKKVGELEKNGYIKFTDFKINFFVSRKKELNQVFKLNRRGIIRDIHGLFVHLLEVMSISEFNIVQNGSYSIEIKKNKINIDIQYLVELKKVITTYDGENYYRRYNVDRQKEIVIVKIYNDSLIQGTIDPLLKDVIEQSYLNTMLPIYHSKLFGNILNQGLSNEVNSIIRASLIRFENMLEQYIEKDVSYPEKEYQEILKPMLLYVFPGYSQLMTEYTMETIDGKDKRVDYYLKGAFNDLLIELKLPKHNILTYTKNRNNYNGSSALFNSVLQLQRYKLSIENEYQKNGVQKEIKAILIIGHSSNFDMDQKRINDYQNLKNCFKDVNIITYDELLESAKQLLETELMWY